MTRLQSENLIEGERSQIFQTYLMVMTIPFTRCVWLAYNLDGMYNYVCIMYVCVYKYIYIHAIIHLPQ